MFEWNGSGWVEYTVGANALAPGSVTSAQIAADANILGSQLAADVGMTGGQIGAGEIGNANLSASSGSATNTTSAFSVGNMIPDPQFTNATLNALRVADIRQPGTRRRRSPPRAATTYV